MDRRDFLQLLGIGATTAGTLFSAVEIVGQTDKGVLVKSEDLYSGFTVEKLKKGKFPYEVDPAVLKQMSHKQIIFSRNRWDPARMDRPALETDLTHENLVKGEGKIPNQTRLDYALMAASWFHAHYRGGELYDWETKAPMTRSSGMADMPPWNPADIDMTWEEASLAVKHAAKFYGASQAGVAELNPLWLYGDHYSPRKDERERTIPVLSEGERFEQTDEAWYIPKSMNRVISLAFEEYYYGIGNSPGRLASAATGDGYSRMAVTSSSLAEFIRALGYRAIPAGNGVGLSIPMAIDAGLGQLGRMGILVTPKYGPRVRLAKVITDMPLIPDTPINFGVTEFCNACKLCATQCPSGSVTKDEQTWKGNSVSNNPGIYKWYTHPESCFDFNGFSCSNCKRVCPFNKPNNSWLHKMTRLVIDGRLELLDKLMVTFDQASGYGEQYQDSDFWKLTGDKCITAREEM